MAGVAFFRIQTSHGGGIVTEPAVVGKQGRLLGYSVFHAYVEKEVGDSGADLHAFLYGTEIHWIRGDQRLVHVALVLEEVIDTAGNDGIQSGYDLIVDAGRSEKLMVVFVAAAAHVKDVGRVHAVPSGVADHTRKRVKPGFNEAAVENEEALRLEDKHLRLQVRDLREVQRRTQHRGEVECVPQSTAFAARICA